MREPILTLDKYEILGTLGTGGMATVYAARLSGPMGFQKSVAVKVLLDEAAEEDEIVRMFIDEARLGARLSHPNIASVLEFGESGGRYWLAMEFVDGASLNKIIKAQGRRKKGREVPPAAVAWVGVSVLRALAYAHSIKGQDGKTMGVVHRDVSPQNILIDLGGSVKLADFGIATGSYRVDRTRSGVIKGKAAYMAPEQASGQKVDSRSDLYSLGLTLVAMLSGTAPFSGQDTGEIRARAAKGLDATRIDSLPCDEALKDVLRTALAANPRDRFQDAEAFAQALAEAMPDPVESGRKALAALVTRVSGSDARNPGTRRKPDRHGKAPEPAAIRPGSSDRALRNVLIATGILLLAALALAFFNVTLPE